MKSQNESNKGAILKRRVYTILLTAVFGWPWVASDGKGELLIVVTLGLLGVIFCGAIIAFVETKKHPVNYRLAAGLALATAFFLQWAIPAVGVLGKEGDPADLMYS